jgi:hypothetical protein
MLFLCEVVISAAELIVYHHRLDIVKCFSVVYRCIEIAQAFDQECGQILCSTNTQCVSVTLLRNQQGLYLNFVIQTTCELLTWLR